MVVNSNTLYLKVKTSVREFNLTTQVTTSDFKEELYSKVFKYKLVSCK